VSRSIPKYLQDTENLLKQRAVPCISQIQNTEDTSHEVVTVTKHGENHLLPVFERGVEAFFSFS